MGEGKSKAGGEFSQHKERTDGTRDLYFGKLGAEDHGHAVIDTNGNVVFLRDSDGRIIADTKK